MPENTSQRRLAHASRKDFGMWWRVKTRVFMMTLREGRELVGWGGDGGGDGEASESGRGGHN